MNELPKRKNIRLKGYDYSSNGVYFITICVENRRCILSTIYRRGDPCGRLDTTLTELGEICAAEFNTIETMYPICKENNVIMGQLWQRNYYEHIIRDQNDYLTKWNYIDTNPTRWEDDEYFYRS